MAKAIDPMIRIRGAKEHNLKDIDIDILSKSCITLIEQSIIKIKNYEDSKH